ncbi:hypothetical protein A6A29_08795 [Streptomyces sp. TSRI0281]|nr:hypothetical protein A6A29_08795 [Streptomyces sp. TSRI0281]
MAESRRSGIAAEWAPVQPLLPRTSSGRSRLDDRTVLNGMVRWFRTAVARRDAPERYESRVSLHQRLVSVDSSTVPAVRRCPF